MKKIVISAMACAAAVILIVAFIISAILPKPRNDSLQGWLDVASAQEAERIEQIENALIEEYGECEMKSYPMKHLNNTFFQNISDENKMAEFISEKYNILTIVLSADESNKLVYNTDYDDSTRFGDRVIRYDGSNSFHKVPVPQALIVPKDFMSFISNIDEDIKDGKFGKVKDVSLLSATFYSFFLNIEKCSVSLEVVFAYIQSDNGEFLVPYTIYQDGSIESVENVLENGKIYTLEECVNILDAKLFTTYLSWVDKTDKSFLESIKAVISVLIGVVLLAAVVVGSVFGVKALLKYLQTKSTDKYDF